jgi:diguanylate cyclase
VPAQSASDDAKPAATLRLQAAMQLLAQSGRSLPEGMTRGSLPWLQAVIDALCELSSRDALTGLANRRQFELAIAREVDRVARAGEPALVLMADIDHFKRVNDTFGHPAGDAVLVRVVQTVQGLLTSENVLCRVGGEEFAVIAPGLDRAAALNAADAVRMAIERVNFDHEGKRIALTVSLGVAELGPTDSPTDLFKRADERLYASKIAGRNRVS